MKRLALFFLLTTPALADPPPNVDLNSPIHKWFHAQHSVAGVWCCDISDGHVLNDEDWRMASDAYEIRIHGQWIKVPEKALRDPNGGPNPTGHAIAWYNITPYGVMLYCFAPGFSG